jgi:hypothetical protein
VSRSDGNERKAQCGTQKTADGLETIDAIGR